MSRKRLAKSGEGSISASCSSSSSDNAQSIDGISEGSSSSTSFSNKEMHPMHNPVILANFFDLCPPKLLATFRLVSKQWQDLSLPPWRSSSPLTIHADSLHSKYANSSMPPLKPSNNDDHGTEPETTPFHHLLDTMQDPQRNYITKPFRNIHLIGLRFKMEDNLFERFWKLVGSTTHHLKLTDCVFKTNSFRQVIYESFPNMKELTLQNCSFPLFSPYYVEPSEYSKPVSGEHSNLKSIIFESGFPSIELHVSWLELLSHFPALTSIKLKEAQHLSYEDIKRMLDAVKLIRRHDPKKLLLKDFDIQPISVKKAEQGVAPSLEIFELIKELHIPLKSVQIGIKKSDSHFIQDVVNVHGKILTKLELVGIGTSTLSISPLLGFPFGVDLINLQKLIMTELSCENMTFLKHTPNLRKLHILRKIDNNGRYDMGTRMVSNTDKSDMGNVKLLKLTELQLEYVITEDELRSLAEWMPNLKVLGMILSDRLFRMVSESWSSLECLDDIGTLLTNDGVVGVTGAPSFFQNLRKFSSLSENLIRRSVSRKLPNLKLLNLPRKLEIETKQLELEKRVTEISEKYAKLKNKMRIFKKDIHLGRI